MQSPVRSLTLQEEKTDISENKLFYFKDLFWLHALWSLKENIGSHESGVMGSYELPEIGAGDLT